MKNFLTLLFSFSFLLLNAQDAYHTNLNNFLQTEYSLPEGEFLVGNTETSVLGNVQNWGVSKTTEDATDQDFAKYSRVIVSTPGNNPWDRGWKLPNPTTIGASEKLLLVFWLKVEGIPPASGQANVFVERDSDYFKEFYSTLQITSQWRQFFVPVEATGGTYSANSLSMGFHIGAQAQTIQIGGFTVLKYDSSVAFDDLPNQYYNDEYGGFESDAPWREIAAQNIETFRKSDLVINAQTTDGTPVPNAAFDIQMTQHEYAFGSAITASRIAGNNMQNVIYENKIKNLDGQGHGFNWVVFENDMKWDAWEEEWFVNNQGVRNAVDWLAAENIKVRGHNLVWPGWQYLPDDLQSNANNPDYIWERIDGRLDNILNQPGFMENVLEWDVLNEIVVNTSFEPVFDDWNGNTTGREIYADIFTRAKEISPETKMYINDYVTMSLGNTAGNSSYEGLKNKIQEIIDTGAPLEGIGFQGHIGGAPNSIYDILDTYDDFYNQFGLTQKITEFDLPGTVNEEIAANYLRDFLTATFSHESTDGFFFWNFWDGATWQSPAANIFNLDWTMKPAGEAFIDLVFNEWWTNEQKTANTNGVVNARVFKGMHEITYICNGETVTEAINLADNQEITITCDNLQTETINIAAQNSPEFSVYPNPATDFIYIEKLNNETAQVRLFDVAGKVLFASEMNDSILSIPTDTLKGIYFAEILQGEYRFYEKVVVD